MPNHSAAFYQHLRSVIMRAEGAVLTDGSLEVASALCVVVNIVEGSRSGAQAVITVRVLLISAVMRELVLIDFRAHGEVANANPAIDNFDWIGQQIIRHI